MLFSCNKNDSSASVIATLPQTDMTYMQGDTVVVAARGVSPDEIQSLSINIVTEESDSVLTSNSQLGLYEMSTDTILLVISDSLRDSSTVSLVYVLDELNEVKSRTRSLLYLTIPDTLVSKGTWTMYHVYRGQDNVFDHIQLDLGDYDSDQDIGYSFLDISQSSESLLYGITSPDSLSFVSISSFDVLDHRSIQTAYYNGTKQDTLFNINNSSEFVTYEERGAQKFYTAVKMDSILDNGNPQESFYRFQVKQYIK